MLSDRIKEILTERLADRIEKLNTRILTKITKDIDELGKLTPTDAQQLANVLKYGGDYQKLIKEIQNATNLNTKDIEKMLDEIAKKNYMNAEEYYKIKKLNYLPYDQNLELKQQVEAIKTITQENFINLSNTNAIGFTVKDKQGNVLFKDISSAYRDAIDEAVLNIYQGKETFEKAFKNVINELGESGLKTVNYQSGRSMRLDSATRMSVQGAIRDMENQVQLEIAKQTKSDGIEVSVHEHPAPDHELIQGHQFTINKYDEYGNLIEKGEYEKFEDDEPFEDVNGRKYPVTERHIGMWNCYHNIFAINVGISKPLYSQEELDNIIERNKQKVEIDGKEYTQYECTQLQRKLETEIRKQKDIQIMGRTANKQDVVNEAQGKINTLTNKYNELSKKANIPTQKQRMQVSGYRKVKITKSNNTSNINYFEINDEVNVDKYNKMLTKAEKFKNSLPQKEYTAIKHYVGTGYDEINETLVYGEPKNGYDLYNNVTEIKDDIKYIDNAMQKSIIDENIVTYKGTFNKFFENYKIGDEFELPIYYSTTTKMGVADKFLKAPRLAMVDKAVVEIRVPKGTRSIYMGDMYRDTNEFELLLDRNIKYKLISNKKINSFVNANGKTIPEHTYYVLEVVK